MDIVIILVSKSQYNVHSTDHTNDTALGTATGYYKRFGIISPGLLTPLMDN